jgi:5-methylcytosine-specific restriction protein A
MDKTPLVGPLTLNGQAIAEMQLIKRADLHREWRGNSGSGISALGSDAIIFAFSGDAGKSFGYQDTWMEDGRFRYYGEGQIGDMVLLRGNKAIHEHVKNNTRLFLFDSNTGVSGHVLFRGEFKLDQLGEDRGKDSRDQERRRFYFDLLPIDNDEEEEREDIESQDLFDEGWTREIKHNRSERNREAVKKAKDVHGTQCQVCGFDFGLTYGPHGQGFIEVHHLLRIIDGRRKTNPKRDMRVVCSNCHRMLHRGRKLLSIEELQQLMGK